MSTELSQEFIAGLAQQFSKDSTARIIQNAVTQNPITQIAEDHQIVASIDPSMSIKVDRWPITNQKKSGRCWIFSGLNSLKSSVYKDTNLESFEFSQTYQHFWDKFEKANYFLSAMIDLADRDVDDRTVHHLLSDPIGDGGQWNMFVALVEKYGVVPKYAMPETESSSNTAQMNRVLEILLRRSALDLREAAPEERDALRLESMKQVYRLLSIHLGTPPEKFIWQWEDKEHVFHRDGEFTPQEFAAKYISDLNDYVCIVNDPRNEYYRLYSVERLGNVVGAPPVTYLNVPIEIIRDSTIASLKDGLAVWMGCDTGKQSDSKRGIWDEHLYDYEGTYGIDLEMSKSETLIYGEAMMTHAMVFTGVDLLDEKPRRWRIENSWGDESGEKGFYTMNDSWFEPHVFEVAVRRQYIDEKYLAALDTKPIMLPAWDPMGSLA